MYPASFDYYLADSVAEAVALLEQHDEAKLLAGGHSLLPAMKLRLAQPPVLVDIGRIAELRGVTRTNGQLRIGALTTHAELAASETVQQHCPLLAEAAQQIGDPQVRNRGTIGGNLVHADPGSDLPAAVLAAGGVIYAVGPGGERSIAADDLCVDLLTVCLDANEVLTAVELPVLGKRTGSCYLKFEHPASGYAICGAAAVVTISDDGSCAEASLCFNGITATPWRADSVTAALRGRELSESAIDKAVVEHLSFAEPMGDIFASGSYRVELARVFARRVLRHARDRAAR